MKDFIFLICCGATIACAAFITNLALNYIHGERIYGISKSGKEMSVMKLKNESEISAIKRLVIKMAKEDGLL